MMRRLSGFGIGIFFLLLSGQVFAGERPRVHFDQRPWKLGLSNQKPDVWTQEYILQGETLDNWTEVLIVQFFPGLEKRQTVEQMLAGTKIRLEQQCPRVEFKTLNKGEKDALYQWTIHRCPGQADQTEIVRLLKGGEGFYLCRYAVKREKWSEEKQKEWIKLLNDFVIVSD